MNTLKDTLGTLKPHTKDLVEMVMQCSRTIFEDDKQQVAPMIFFIKPGDEKITVVEIPEEMMRDENKPKLWDTVRKLRRKVPTVAFISEVWKSNPKPWDGIKFDKDAGTVNIMPRNDPNRTECVMINLWEMERLVTFSAEITRNPDKLDEWVAFYDSYFPGDKQGVEGAMLDGQPCAIGGN